MPPTVGGAVFGAGLVFQTARQGGAGKGPSTLGAANAHAQGPAGAAAVTAMQRRTAVRKAAQAAAQALITSLQSQKARLSRGGAERELHLAVAEALMARDPNSDYVNGITTDSCKVLARLKGYERWQGSKFIHAFRMQMRWP